MSIAGISSALLGVADAGYAAATGRHQFRAEFQQLGQDLSAGNLSAAQADFATFQQRTLPGNWSGTSANSTSNSSTSPLAQDFHQLSSDLQAGNLTAAQQDYAKIQQDFQTQTGHAHHHHQHREMGNSGLSDISQLFSQLGQDLQSGDLSAAQQAYQSLALDFQAFQTATSSTSGSASNPVSVSV